MTTPPENETNETDKQPMSSSTKIKIGVTIAMVSIVSFMLLLAYIITSIVTRPSPSTPPAPPAEISAPPQP